MKILVTGGAGFIGSHIVDSYLALGHEVVVVDNLVTGKKEYVNANAKFYEIDVRDDEMEEVFAEENPELVSHHAAQMDISKSVAEPVYDADVNILGSLKVIQYAINSGVRKIIFASTGGAIYGEPKKLPVSETHLQEPTSPYGVAKRTIEGYLFAFGKYSNLDYTVLRYANVYGPRQNAKGEAGVCAIFTGNLLADTKCVLYGHGSPVRDYIYVADVVTANVLAIDKGSKGTYNLGTGIGTTVKEIYELLQKYTGNKKEPQLEELRNGELQGIYLDSTKAKEELGWESKVNLKEGLQQTVEYFRG